VIYFLAKLINVIPFALTRNNGEWAHTSGLS